MKKLFFIIYLLAISCSNNKDSDLVDIKSFLNQGEKINLNQKKIQMIKMLERFIS